MALSVEQQRSLIELLRAYQELKAEALSLAAILEKAEREQALPIGGWKANLAALRGTPAYQNIVQQHNGMLAQAESLTDSAEIENLLKMQPSTRIQH